MDKSSIGNRFKNYEAITNFSLIKRIPVIIRLDGKAFHTFVRRKYGKKTYSKHFNNIMWQIAKYVQSEIQGCKLAYVQSDEMSFLLTDYENLETQGWYDYRLNKILSIAAGLASAMGTYLFGECVVFDARAFNLSKEEVCNYFIWRQQDATRNSILMLGQENFSHKQLQNQNCSQIQDMLMLEKNINWNDCPTYRKRGICIANNNLDLDIPIFSKDRKYIEKFI